MIDWGEMGYGAALAAIAAAVLPAAATRVRRPAVIVAGPVAWNAILRVVHGDRLFTDAPSPSSR